MPNFVARVLRFDPSAAPPEAAHSSGIATITLEEHGNFSIDRGDPYFPAWAELLTDTAGRDLPIYVETQDEEPRVVRRVFLPQMARILSITERQDRLAVRTLTSPREYWIKQSDEVLRNRLENAISSAREVRITVDPATGEVIHASPFDVSGAADVTQISVIDSPMREHIREEELNSVFVSLQRCNVPFDYLHDGCATRAHEMSRVLLQQGIRHDKIWLYGENVHFLTPYGDVRWGFHVAVRIRVRLDGGRMVDLILDPGTFSRPVDHLSWFKAIDDPTARFEFADAKFYGRSQGEAITILDPTFAKTSHDLGVLRSQRRNLLVKRFIA